MEMLDILEVLETEHGIFTNNEVTGQTAEEVYDEWLEQQEQIDNCSPIPTNEELNNQLVETQKLCLSLQKQILLK